MVLDESGVGMRVVLDESGVGMKVVLDELVFYQEAVLIAVKNRDEGLEALAQGEKSLEELPVQQRR